MYILGMISERPSKKLRCGAKLIICFRIGLSLFLDHLLNHLFLGLCNDTNSCDSKAFISLG